MWQSATGGVPRNLDRDPSPIHSHSRSAIGTRPLKTLLVTDNPKLERRMLSAIRMTPADVECVSTLGAALIVLAHDFFDVTMLDRHLGGWVSTQTCKNLVVKACGIPVVGLINADCVLGLRDGIESGLTGVYYKDQINVHLMRRLARLAYLPSVDASLVVTSLSCLLDLDLG
jgi:hypothetical protein